LGCVGVMAGRLPTYFQTDIEFDIAELVTMTTTVASFEMTRR
jgi:hypothetical protein